MSVGLSVSLICPCTSQEEASKDRLAALSGGFASPDLINLNAACSISGVALVEVRYTGSGFDTISEIGQTRSSCLVWPPIVLISH